MATEFETIIVARNAGVVTVTMNRPARKNAANGTMWNELLAVFGEVTADRHDRVMILTGAGDAFCSGADLGDASDVAGLPGDPYLVQMRALGEVALALHRIPKPTIAKVGGVAAGAGMSMALGCDLVVASDTARFSQIFSKRGLSVDFGASWLLPRFIGMHRANWPSSPTSSTPSRPRSSEWSTGWSRPASSMCSSTNGRRGWRWARRWPCR
jgi:2-(1,2-epoxy-1,2-dihydrophenyl)acetyl-CoA isomerase